MYGAGWTDLCSGKVRNQWLLAGAIIGAALRGGDFFLAAVAVLIPAYLLFRARLMGAGDGKLMALIAGYLGLDAGLRAIGTGMAVGAVWSLCRIWHDRTLLLRFVYLNAYIRRTILTKEMAVYEPQTRQDKYKKLPAGENRHTIPLAACLAAGTYLYLLISCAAAMGKELL